MKSNQELTIELKDLKKNYDSLNVLMLKNNDELLLINKKLEFENKEKEKRAEELVIANKELAFQNREKLKQSIELGNAREKANASERLKIAFMNNISHEIRTPLNGILGFASLIIQPNILDNEKKEYVEILNTCSRRLINTINNFMDISLIMSGNMEVHPYPVDIKLLLTKVNDDFKESCQKKNIELKLQFPVNIEHYVVNADGALLMNAISKLIDNSLKFTNEGSIVLGFNQLNNKIEFFVKDTGVGIEKDSQARILKSFMQENVSVTRDYQGSGLGLSIAKGIVHLLGGRMHLASSKDEGTSVFLYLPIVKSCLKDLTKNPVASQALNGSVE